MKSIHSKRCVPARSILHVPVMVSEEVSLPSERQKIEPVWQDMLRAMARQRGCLSLECKRTPEGFCLCSRWTSWREFADWTEATIFMVVAAELDNRRVAVLPLKPDVTRELSTP